MSQEESRDLNAYEHSSQSENTQNDCRDCITNRKHISSYHSARPYFHTSSKKSSHTVPSTSNINTDSHPSSNVNFYASNLASRKDLSSALFENKESVSVSISEDEECVVAGPSSTRNGICTSPSASKANGNSVFSNRNDIVDDEEDIHVNVDSNEEHNQNDLFSSDDYSETHQVILSVVYRKGRLGAAVYAFETSEIQLFNDIVDVSPEFKLLTTLFLQIQPTQIVTCPSQLSVFHQRLQNLSSGATSNISSGETALNGDSVPISFAPNKEFEYKNSQRRILHMKVASVPRDATDEELRNYIISKVNLQAESMTSALGGLLYFLHKPLSKALLTDINKENLVWVDEETFHALQIFNPVLHPSSFKWSGQTASKEGLSILSLFNRCQSLLGSKHMRVLMTQPTNNIDVLKRRQEVIEFCLKPEYETIVEDMGNCIKEIRCISKILTRMIHVQASIIEWKSFFKTLQHSINIVTLCRSVPDRPEFFNKINECGTEILYVIADTITRIIDFDTSESQGRIVIKEGIFEELDMLKERHAQMPLAMTNIAKQELEQLPDYIQSCSLVYIPEIGFLLAVKFWKPDITDEELQQLENVAYKFKAKDTAHYKSATCYELDDMLGDILVRILELETKIALKLIQFIQENIDPLRPLMRHIEELDCLIAMSKVARDHEFVKPTLVKEQVIDISEGRHPLQELYVNAFVPNNTESSFEKGLVTILTGPNACGKSVYLKQIALITYLAHIGSFVPAKCCTIGLMDHIHACLRTVESVTGFMSAFLIDLRQVSLSTYNSSPNSLIIIDEFGKGTNEIDGLAILASCIQHFVGRADKCPHIFVSTHYHTLSDNLPSSPLIKLQTLEHIDNMGEVVYLYRLKYGSAKSSFAIQVALATGMASEITERSKQILDALRKDGTVTPADSCQKKVHIELRRKNFIAKFIAMKFEDQTDLDILVNDLKALKQSSHIQ